MKRVTNKAVCRTFNIYWKVIGFSPFCSDYGGAFKSKFEIWIYGKLKVQREYVYKPNFDLVDARSITSYMFVYFISHYFLFEFDVIFRLNESVRLQVKG